MLLTVSKFFSSFTKTRKRQKTSIAVAFLGLIIILGLLFLLQSKTAPTLPFNLYPTKSWKLQIAYDVKTKKISLSTISIVNFKTLLDDRPSAGSPYTLTVYASNNDVVYQTKIFIRQQIVDYLPTDPKAPRLPNVHTTDIYVPYIEDATTIQIMQNNTAVLKISIPKKVSFNLIDKAYAAPHWKLPTNTCGPAQVVFLNDGYSDKTQFQQDVQYLENLYTTTVPYNENSGMFDFKEIDDEQHFGCGSDIFGCFTANADSSQGITTIPDIAKRQYPQAQFFVVVANATTAQDKNNVGGITGGPGDNVAIYTNRLTPGFNKKFGAATHEFLGHDVGLLYDRYVINDDYAKCMNAYPYEQIAPGDVTSNCSSNQGGDFTNQGCASSINWSHAPLTCGNDFQHNYNPSDCTFLAQSHNIDSGGTYDTIMSGVGCWGATSGFDAYETNWIRTNILPRYKACTGTSPQLPVLPTVPVAGSPTTTATTVPTTSVAPTRTGSPTPTSTATQSNAVGSNPAVPAPGQAGATQENVFIDSDSGLQYNCVPDPSCVSQQGSLQICKLVCTPK